METKFLPVGLLFVCLFSVNGVELSLHPGHMKPFGHGGPFVRTEEIFGHYPPQQFFNDHVYNRTPIVLRGAATKMDAFSKWNDAYLEGFEDEVSIEMSNDQRNAPVLQKMSLSKFIRTYNGTNMYMISRIPETLRTDVQVPCQLQCPSITKELMAQEQMWLSSTNSISDVHTDPAENLNCVLRGKKTFVLVNPRHRYRMAALSDEFDLDAVNYEQNAWMVDMDFHVVNLTAGDCIYIPYLWYHQVRSFGNTLAVNLWWSHYGAEYIDFSKCNNKQCEPNLTMADCSYIGVQELEARPSEYRDYLSSIFDGQNIASYDKDSLHGFVKMVFGENVPKEESVQLFEMLDHNNDGIVQEQEDIQNLPKTVLPSIKRIMHKLYSWGNRYDDEL